MQRCYSRLAVFHKLVCLSGKSHRAFNQKTSRFFSISIPRLAKAKVRQRALDDENHPAYISPSKLPPVKDRQHTDAWILLLNSVLPAHLRATVPEGLRSSQSIPDSTITPRDVALILRRAQRSYGLDILTCLGVEKGQWKAITWLLTRIVDHLWDNNLEVLPKLPGPWKTIGSLHLKTEQDRGIILEPSDDTAPKSFRSLDELTSEASPLHEYLDKSFAHETLGVIWRSLGNMIIADAARTDKPESTITPEILEVIALLHHNGIMPSSIYSYQPSDDLNALRQPPTLHLLSSHILTSLSDAAWGAHQSLVVEAAKSQGGEYLSMRPEIPGSMYKVRVASLGHEVWLELVLWSCLYGKWTEEGASILQNVIRDKSWSALSWRELAAPLLQPGQEKTINWDQLKYRLNAGQIYGDPKLTTATKSKVKRTISAEVVAAFVDGLLDNLRTSVGTRGTPAAQALQYISQFKAFLDRNNLSLGSTSWDAVIYRFFDSQGLDIDKEPALAERVIRILSSEFGEELSANNGPTRNELYQPLPAYVLDGTAASMGLMHRVLQAYVQIGNLGGALRTFEGLQRMTDKNKQKSIQAFFTRQTQERTEQADDISINFESRFTGIEYPGFYPQLPGTILAPFLDLLVETRSFEFGKWLLHSEDIDGPIIPETMWTDPIVGPALVRFVSAVDDVPLLVKVLEKQGKAQKGDSKIPQGSLLALLESQVQLKKWNVVDKILSIVNDTPGYPLEGRSVAILARAMLIEIDPYQGPVWDATKHMDLDSSFRNLIRVCTDAARLKSNLSEKTRTTLMVLACINSQWERFILSLLGEFVSSQRYTMTPGSFNIILDGVVSTYGSNIGKAFLGKFWRAAVDETIKAPPEGPEDRQASVTRMPSQRPGTSFESSPVDISITLGRDPKGPNRKPARLYGAFKPSTSIVNSVFRQLLIEHKDDAARRRQDQDWARRLMRLIGMREADIEQEVGRVLQQVRVK